MYRKACIAAAIALVAIAANAANAAALELPSIRTALAGEKYPIIVEGHVEAEDDGGDKGAGWVASFGSILFEAKEATALGSYAMTFTGTREAKAGGAKCNSPGDAEGVLLFKGETHLVFDLFSPKLELASLFLFTPLIMLCSGGAIEIEFKGPMMGRLVPEPESDGDSTSIESRHLCSSLTEAIQEILSYYNDSGTLLTNQLMSASNGVETVNACLFTPTVLLSVTSASTAKMFTVLY